jgi:hypothetical protein
MKKPGFSLDDHRQTGNDLKTAYDLIQKTRAEIGTAYPQQTRAAEAGNASAGPLMHCSRPRTKAFIEGATGRLMLHLGPIAVQFQLPTEQLHALARGINEQA